MMSVPSLPWISRSTSQTQSRASRSSRIPDDDENDDDSTLAENAKLLSITLSLSSFFTRSRSPRRTVSYHRIVTAVSLVTFVVVTSFLTYILATRGREAKDEITVSAKPTKALVLASYHDQDVSWLHQVSPDWHIHRYIVDDPHYTELSTPRNQGREAMPYLTYIIDNYDSPPAYTVFVHGHERAWHQPETLPMSLAALNLAALDEERYINLRCATGPGCTKQTYMNIQKTPMGDDRPAAKLLPQFWKMLFEHDTGIDDMGPPPTELAVPCCAQFAVTRQAILGKSLAFWEKLRRPLERDLSEFHKELGEGLDSYVIGLLYEKLWHVVFGKPGVHCPAPDYCQNVHFSGAIECDRYTTTYDQALAMPWQNISCHLNLDRLPSKHSW